MKADGTSTEGRPAHSVQILRGPAVHQGLTAPRVPADKAPTIRELSIS